MADRPILFSAPMVRALLAGTKTQTRRIMKPRPVDLGGDSWHVMNAGGGDWGVPTERMGEVAPDYLRIATGDRLWVKETWRTYVSLDTEKPSDLWSPEQPRGAAIFYEAGGGMSITKDEPRERYYGADDAPMPDGAGKVRVSIHMPRWASRLTLHVTDVRVERLQDIREDALAEGIVYDASRFQPHCPFGVVLSDRDIIVGSTAVRAYRVLWETINGAGSWDANPWIAAYTFTVERANIDQARA